MKSKFYHQNKLFVKFFISYLILLIFSLAMFGAAYISFEKDKKEYFYQYNISMLEQSKHIIENYINEVELISDNFETNPVISDLCAGRISTDEFKENNYIELNRILYEIRSRTKVADKVYLYITKEETVLSDSEVMSAKTFYNSNPQYKNMEYSDFESSYLNVYDYKKFSGFSPSGQLENSYITYSQSFPENDYKRSDFKLLIRIDSEKIGKVLNPISGGGDALTMILDKSGNVIYKNSKDIKTDPKKLVRYLSKNSDIIELSNTNEMLTYTKSKEENGWIYAVALSKDVFLSEITRLKHLVLLFSLGYLVVGVFIAQLLLKKNYQPIKHIIDKLSRNSEVKTNYRDEMDFIHSVVEDLTIRNKKMNDVISKQSEQMKTAALGDILTGSANAAAIEEVFKKYNLPFIYENYAVVVVSVNDIKDYSDDEKSVIYYAINNMADELFSALYLFEKIIDTSGNIAFMVNVEDENEEAFIEDVKFVCELLSDIMTNEFSVKVGISISSLRKGIESLANSYNEAITALSASCENITDYRDIQTNRVLKMISDIEKYIDAHYMNNNLSNTVIADEFNITGQYLSVLFKKHKGENLQNYIARVRVDYAKELLKSEKYTVFQIANMVGYSNDIGFIRMFKKLEGITPGKYRQMHINKDFKEE